VVDKVLSCGVCALFSNEVYKKLKFSCRDFGARIAIYALCIASIEKPFEWKAKVPEGDLNLRVPRVCLFTQASDEMLAGGPILISTQSPIENPTFEERPGCDKAFKAT
jgi:hypothetical protein